MSLAISPLTHDPEQLHRLFAECASAGDLAGLMVLYEKGATFVAPDAAHVEGARAIRERLQDLLAASPQITPLASRAVVAGEVALVSSRWRMTFSSEGDEQGGGLEGRSTEVARRQADGSWLYVIDDPSSAIAAPMSARQPSVDS